MHARAIAILSLYAPFGTAGMSARSAPHLDQTATRKLWPIWGRLPVDAHCRHPIHQASVYFCRDSLTLLIAASAAHINYYYNNTLCLTL